MSITRQEILDFAARVKDHNQGHPDRLAAFARKVRISLEGLVGEMDVLGVDCFYSGCVVFGNKVQHTPEEGRMHVTDGSECWCDPATFDFSGTPDEVSAEEKRLDEFTEEVDDPSE